MSKVSAFRPEERVKPGLRVTAPEGQELSGADSHELSWINLEKTSQNFRTAASQPPHPLGITDSHDYGSNPATLSHAGVGDNPFEVVAPAKLGSVIETLSYSRSSLPTPKEVQPNAKRVAG